MPRSKPQPIRLQDMKPGQFGDFYVYLSDRVRSATREGKPYYSCKFRDAQRTAAFMVWADGPWFGDCEKQWKVGQFFKVRGVYQEHKQYGPQLDVHNIRFVNEEDLAEGFDRLDFVESSRFHPDQMLAELKQLAAEQISDQPLRRLVLEILDRHEEELKILPATQRHFYPFAGGLLEHIVSVTRSCILLADNYTAYYPELQPPLNKNLIVAAAILHDIGRVLEFESNLVAPEPTVEGRLLGHLFLGRDLVREAARDIDDLDPELLQLLEHLIISHLNHPEWGSPKLPLIPEVLILHHADDLDAKLEMYVRCLSRDQEDAAFTARDPALNRRLLKRRNL